MMKTVTVVGLQDGKGTGSTAHLLRQIRALGLDVKVKLASTGRVTVRRANGERTDYVLELDPIASARNDNPTTIEAHRNADSPLSRALRDLQDGK